MTTNMTPIATINHNDQAGVRVTLYTVDGDSNIWAAAPDEEPYRTDIAIEDMGQAWSDPVWDLQTIDA